MFDAGDLTNEAALELEAEARRLARQAWPSKEELEALRAEGERLASQVSPPDESRLQQLADQIEQDLMEWQQRYRQELQALNDDLDKLAMEHDGR